MRELESKEIQTVSGGSLVNISSIDFNLAVTGAFFQPNNVVLQSVGNFMPWGQGGIGNIGGVGDEREES